MFPTLREDEDAFRKLNTPTKVQDYLDSIPFNFEKEGPTVFSPVRVLKEKKAHCLEGALLAAAAFWINGGEPLLIDLVPVDGDDMHVVAPFKVKGHWGAVSKTNHAVLRFRDPIYKTLRELVFSYFHEYFLNTNGKKTLRVYSKPYNLKVLGNSWITSQNDVLEVDSALNKIAHYPFVPKGIALRPASLIERKAGKIVEHKK